MVLSIICQLLWPPVEVLAGVLSYLTLKKLKGLQRHVTVKDEEAIKKHAEQMILYVT